MDWNTKRGEIKIKTFRRNGTNGNGNGNGIYIPHFLYAYIQMRFTLLLIMKQHKDQTSTPGTPCPTLCD